MIEFHNFIRRVNFQDEKTFSRDSKIHFPSRKIFRARKLEVILSPPLKFFNVNFLREKSGAVHAWNSAANEFCLAADVLTVTKFWFRMPEISRDLKADTLDPVSSTRWILRDEICGTEVR